MTGALRRTRMGDVVACLLSSDRGASPPSVVAGPPPASYRNAFRLRLAVFADIALALAEALEAASAAAAVVKATDAVRRAFSRLSPPTADADGAAAYRVAQDIATTDCDFAGWASRRQRDAGRPDLILVGYGRWVREQLALIRA
jgi:hypothetical protein